MGGAVEGDFTTIHFFEFPDLTFITDQYLDLEVLFTDGNDFISGPSYWLSKRLVGPRRHGGNPTKSTGYFNQRCKVTGLPPLSMGTGRAPHGRVWATAGRTRCTPPIGPSDTRSEDRGRLEGDTSVEERSTE